MLLGVNSEGAGAWGRGGGERVMITPSFSLVKTDCAGWVCFMVLAAEKWAASGGFFRAEAGWQRKGKAKGRESGSERKKMLTARKMTATPVKCSFRAAIRTVQMQVAPAAETLSFKPEQQQHQQHQQHYYSAASLSAAAAEAAYMMMTVATSHQRQSS